MRDSVNSFFPSNNKIISKKILGFDDIESNFYWLISADKIFESEIEGYKNHARFFHMEFFISRISLYDGVKSSDSLICANDVKIYMPPSRFCAMIQGNLAQGKEISKILVKKVAPISEKLVALEEKEFAKCVIQSFERTEEIAAFTFRCASYSDLYQDIKPNGNRFGKSAVKIDLTTWNVENK